MQCWRKCQIVSQCTVSYEHTWLLRCVCCMLVYFPAGVCQHVTVFLFSLSVQAVVADLRQVHLMTGHEGEKLRNPASVVEVQSKKAPKVMVTTADILRTHGFADEAQTLLGEWTAPHPLALYLQWRLHAEYAGKRCPQLTAPHLTRASVSVPFCRSPHLRRKTMACFWSSWPMPSLARQPLPSALWLLRMHNSMMRRVGAGAQDYPCQPLISTERWRPTQH